MYDLLKGLCIIECASFVAAPSAGLYCAQMGAEVIRIDQIGGGPDFGRWPVDAEGHSFYWENLNRAKKSLTVDFSRPEARELVQQLIAATGQVVTNFPATGFMAHEALAAGRPDLVTIRIMGWPDGRPALDYTVNNAVGYPMLTGPGPDPVNHVLPAWDLLSGSYAAFALLAALRRRSETGQGSEVRIPLSDVAIGTAAQLGGIAEVLYTGKDRPRLGNSVYGLFGRDFGCADGERIMIVVVTARQWSNLIAALDLGDAISSLETSLGVSFATDDGLRFTHRDRLFPLFERAIGSRQPDELTTALDAGGIVYSTYKTMREAASEPKLVTENPMFAPTRNPSGMTYPAAGAFATIPQLQRGQPQSAPRLGQDTEDVLATVLRLSSGEIARLVDDGVVGVAR